MISKDFYLFKRVWIGALGVWNTGMDCLRGMDRDQYHFDGPVVTPVIFLWVKQCHKNPSPRKICSLIGGMFTIPSHG